MIKYLGSKRLLLPRILEQIEPLAGVRTVLDLFSGTSRVGHALKARGYRVHANDHNAYAATLANYRHYVAAGSYHMILDGSGFYGERSGGLPFKVWLDGLLTVPDRQTAGATKKEP